MRIPKKMRTYERAVKVAAKLDEEYSTEDWFIKTEVGYSVEDGYYVTVRHDGTIKSFTNCIDDITIRLKSVYVAVNEKIKEEFEDGMVENGYPTEKCLRKINKWDATDFDGLVEFLRSVWNYPDYFKVANGVAYISTGGWSGNEDLIAALPAAWKYLYKKAWRTGGHYIFTNRKVDIKIEVKIR